MIIILGMLEKQGDLDIARRIYSGGGTSPCINAHGNDTVPKILVKNDNNSNMEKSDSSK